MVIVEFGPMFAIIMEYLYQKQSKDIQGKILSQFMYSLICYTIGFKAAFISLGQKWFFQEVSEYLFDTNHIWYTILIDIIILIILAVFKSIFRNAAEKSPWQRFISFLFFGPQFAIDVYLVYYLATTSLLVNFIVQGFYILRLLNHLFKYVIPIIIWNRVREFFAKVHT